MRKIILSLESSSKFDEILLFFVPDFDLLSCELDNVMFKVLYWYYIKCHFILILYQEKIKLQYFNSSLWKI